MFDWNDLKYFLAVAQHGSTLSAAKSLRVNQSTVHRRIEELERQLGCALVSRHPTGYRLTEMGEHIRARASRVEAAAADFERAVSAKSSELKGTVKVTCPEALGPRLIASRLIEKFNARYPDVRVEFVMSGQNSRAWLWRCRHCDSWKAAGRKWAGRTKDRGHALGGFCQPVLRQAAWQDRKRRGD